MTWMAHLGAQFNASFERHLLRQCRNDTLGGKMLQMNAYTFTNSKGYVEPEKSTKTMATTASKLDRLAWCRSPVTCQMALVIMG